MSPVHQRSRLTSWIDISELWRRPARDPQSLRETNPIRTVSSQLLMRYFAATLGVPLPSRRRR
jgi:hypothetical protein